MNRNIVSFTQQKSIFYFDAEGELSIIESTHMYKYLSSTDHSGSIKSTKFCSLGVQIHVIRVACVSFEIRLQISDPKIRNLPYNSSLTMFITYFTFETDVL